MPPVPAGADPVGRPGPTGADLHDPVAAVAGPAFLDQINAQFEDTLLLVARSVAGHPGAASVRVTGMDAAGVDAVVTDAGGELAVRVPFAEVVTRAEDLTGALFELVDRARGDAGEEGPNSAEARASAMARIPTFVTEVVAVTDVHPHLRQVTFGGGDLTDFSPIGPDTFLYVLLPPPGRTELTVDRTFSWERYALMPDEDKPVGAYYTMRRWRPDEAELDVLMVLHGDGGHEGPASAWASRAAVGDPVALWGPRTSWHPPEGTDHLVLVADETGLPATAVVLEQLPPGVTAQVVAEHGLAGERQELPPVAGAEITWVCRDGAPAGTTSLLVDAVRALPDFPERTYVWGGAEMRAMTAVRRHVRGAHGLSREQVSLVAYWRHHETSDADDDIEGHG